MPVANRLSCVVAEINGEDVVPQLAQIAGAIHFTLSKAAALEAVRSDERGAVGQTGQKIAIDRIGLPTCRKRNGFIGAFWCGYGQARGRHGQCLVASHARDSVDNHNRKDDDEDENP